MALSQQLQKPMASTAIKVLFNNVLQRSAESTGRIHTESSAKCHHAAEQQQQQMGTACQPEHVEKDAALQFWSCIIGRACVYVPVVSIASGVLVVQCPCMKCLFEVGA